MGCEHGYAYCLYGHWEAHCGCRFKSVTMAAWTRVYVSQCSAASTTQFQQVNVHSCIFFFKCVFLHSSPRLHLPLLTASDSPGDILLFWKIIKKQLLWRTAGVIADMLLRPTAARGQASLPQRMSILRLQPHCIGEGWRHWSFRSRKSTSGSVPFQRPITQARMSWPRGCWAGLRKNYS